MLHLVLHIFSWYTLYQATQELDIKTYVRVLLIAHSGTQKTILFMEPDDFVSSLQPNYSARDLG